MLTKFDLVLIALMTGAAAVTYQIKHNAEEQVRAISHLKTQIRLERDTIALQKADWSVLTQPSRLEMLTETYKSQLDLQTIEPTQIATLNDLPTYPRPDDPPIPSGPPPSAKSPAVAKTPTSIDRILTGSVER